MGLGPGDLERVPRNLTAEECYTRIYDWERTQGKRRVQERFNRQERYVRRYLNLIGKLPSPSEANQADMDFVFGEVISGVMEWSYHEQDGMGIKMAAYAHFALNAEYANGFHSEKFQQSRKSSRLYELKELGDVSSDAARQVGKSANEVRHLLRRE